MPSCGTCNIMQHLYLSGDLASVHFTELNRVKCIWIYDTYGSKMVAFIALFPRAVRAESGRVSEADVPALHFRWRHWSQVWHGETGRPFVVVRETSALTAVLQNSTVVGRRVGVRGGTPVLCLDCGRKFDAGKRRWKGYNYLQVLFPPVSSDLTGTVGLKKGLHGLSENMEECRWKRYRTHCYSIFNSTD